MNLNQITNYLRSRSPEAKNRIMVSVIILAVVILGALWVNNIKKEVSALNPPGEVADASLVSTEERIVIEGMETILGKKYIYFKVKNNTNDILNFSPIEKIQLESNRGEVLRPEKILGRQDKIFIKKVLSNSEEFGILVMPDFEQDRYIRAVFDGMFFEQQQDKVFKETLEVDFSKLTPLQELRS